MTLKWATFLFWKVFTPMAGIHFRYYQKKVVIDQMLEKGGLRAIFPIAALFGYVVYHFLVAVFGVQRHSLAWSGMKELDELYRRVKHEEATVVPHLLLERTRLDILGRISVANDRHQLMMERRDQLQPRSGGTA